VNQRAVTYSLCTVLIGRTDVDTRPDTEFKRHPPDVVSIICQALAHDVRFPAGILHRPRLPRPEHGWAVQIDPIKPTVKAPGTERSKLKCDELLSRAAFLAFRNLNLIRA